MPDYDGTGKAQSSYPASEVRGGSREELPQPEDRGGGREDQPHVQGAVAAQAQEGREELLQFMVRRGSCEEIPLVQGKEQKLRFTGAALKRYPTSKVRETQVRWQVSQEASEGRHTNHNHRNLVNLITRTTALSNSMN